MDLVTLLLDGPNTLWNLYGAKNTLILCLASRKEVDLDETTPGPNEALLSPFDDAALFLKTLIRAIVAILICLTIVFITIIQFWTINRSGNTIWPQTIVFEKGKMR